MRPTKLTTQRRDTILNAIRSGLTREQAAKLAGIGTSTLYDWIRRGDNETLEPTNPNHHTKQQLITIAHEREIPISPNWTKTKLAQQIDDNSRTIFSEFSEALHARDAEFELEAVEQIVALGLRESDWRAFAWLLERRFPERWGRSTRGDSVTEVEGSEEEARRAVERSREIRVKLAGVIPIRQASP